MSHKLTLSQVVICHHVRRKPYFETETFRFPVAGAARSCRWSEDGSEFWRTQKIHVSVLPASFRQLPSTWGPSKCAQAWAAKSEAFPVAEWQTHGCSRADSQRARRQIISTLHLFKRPIHQQWCRRTVVTGINI